MERKIIVIDDTDSVVASGLVPQDATLNMDTVIENDGSYRDWTKHIWRVLKNNFELSEISAHIAEVRIICDKEDTSLTWTISGGGEDIVLSAPDLTAYHYTDF